MPADRAALAPGGPTCQAIHATAVAIGGRALLIRGGSRAGKSRLALALLARSSAAVPIHLIGDDRILLHRVPGGLVARPHPRIAGFIERRGLGLVAMPWVAEAAVGGVAKLRHSATPEANAEPVCLDKTAQTAGAGFTLHAPWNDLEGHLLELPQLTLDAAEDVERADRVLAWWTGLTAAWAQHPHEKTDGALLATAQD